MRYRMSSQNEIVENRELADEAILAVAERFFLEKKRNLC